MEKYSEPGRPKMTIRRMRITCWIPTATNTHSESIILIAFPLQQWLHEGPSMLRSTYNAFLLRSSPLYILAAVIKRKFNQSNSTSIVSQTLRFSVF